MEDYKWLVWYGSWLCLHDAKTGEQHYKTLPWLTWLWDMLHCVDFFWSAFLSSLLPLPSLPGWRSRESLTRALYLFWLALHLRQRGVGFGASAVGLETIFGQLRWFLSNGFLTCETRKRLFLRRETSKFQWGVWFWTFFNALLSSQVMKKAKAFSEKWLCRLACQFMGLQLISCSPRHTCLKEAGRSIPPPCCFALPKGSPPAEQWWM